MPGTDRITYFGYDDCILLENTHTRVVLTSSAGRILEYSRKGPNAIYLDPAQEGMVFERKLFQSTFALEDRKEGMEAFLNKRPPNFNNN